MKSAIVVLDGQEASEALGQVTGRNFKKEGSHLPGIPVGFGV